jgi:fluoride exporter
MHEKARIRPMERFLWVFAGGGLGSVARYAVGLLLVSQSQRFAWNTFFVNLTGSFLIGFLVGVFETRLLSPEWRLALVTGFLGGYTTFSALELETLIAWKHGDWSIAVLYPLLSLVLGFAAVAIGMIVGSRL